MIWIQVVIAVFQLALLFLVIRYKVVTERNIGHYFDLNLETFRQNFQDGERF